MQNHTYLKNPCAFLIYDASAGSGKTFTLVKEYLKLILASQRDDYFKHVLAITFTNKAVAEMKQRIVETLVNFSDGQSVEKPVPMMLQIASESGMDLQDIHIRSMRILKTLIHNYAAFSVETIDRFNHRLIRTFARDLKLATNFEVTLDTPQLITEAVELLVGKAGLNTEITKTLLDFALEKTDDDKSWDISRDIASAALLLFNENDSAHVQLLKQKSLQDFMRFKTQLIFQKKKLYEEIESIATTTLELIGQRGLQFGDFSNGYLPKHFQNLALGNITLNYSAKWQETMAEKPLYPTRVSSETANTIKTLTPIFIKNFQQTKRLVFDIFLIENVLKNITPLSVINLVNQEIDTIKNAKNILPISEFNSLINKEIKDQPAPFIYERLGEKYRHFFIDEFQDTSKLQWENLIPLIDNALSQQEGPTPGSLLLVGDAKQSIYRWRGGLPEQYMELCADSNPFSREKKLLSLGTNFRSCAEIVNFNNEFFTFVASFFANPAHNQLYLEGNKQKCTDKSDGYINFGFIDVESKQEKEKAYCWRVLQTINELKSKGFSESNICILTRRRAEGITLGAFLMEHGIPLMSSETLLLASSRLVQILVQAMQVCLNPLNQQARIVLLDLLHEHLEIAEDKHSFFSGFLNISECEIIARLETYSIFFSFEEMRSQSLYEAFEYCIEKFMMIDSADAYLFGFMDLVYEFWQQPTADKISFLDYWEIKKETAAIPASEGTNAVQLMTIHKSKGLEFPVVIFPFADIQLYDARFDKLWYPFDDETFSFQEAQINYKNEIVNYREIGEQMYHAHRSRLELDSLNLLYVTLTRAVEKLYVFSQMPTELKDGIPTTYNQLFMEFLKKKGKWDENELNYEFGKNISKISKNKSVAPQIEPRYFSSNPQKHGLKIVPNQEDFLDSEVLTARSAGNLLHTTMAQIFSRHDVQKVLDQLERRAILLPLQFNDLQKRVGQITQHAELNILFNGKDKVFNERNIITKVGQILRPDRINFDQDNAATIIDYKTGESNIKHHNQLNEYAKALNEMGFQVKEKVLIYSNEDGIIINKV